MAVEIRAPQLGESVVEATVGQWMKEVGDTVNAGEVLCELETDKINIEVSAEQDGVLDSIALQEGDSVEPGDVLAYLSTDGEEAAEPDVEAEEVEKAPAEEVAEPEAVEEEREAPTATPVARRLAEEHGIDIAKIDGSGSGGRVTKEDVEAYIDAGEEAETEEEPERDEIRVPREREKPTPPSPDREPGEVPAREERPPAPAPERARADEEERVRMSRRRQTIARRLLDASQNTAMLTTFNDVDMTAVMELRSKYKEKFQEEHGVRLGFMSFFTKAVIGALKAFPYVNAEIDGDEIVLKHYYDIGIAVSTEEGLVVPVVRNADRKTFVELERDIADLAEKARNRKLTLDDLQGGTFTITNGGVFGSLLSTPILNPPQVGILGMHRIEERPVAVDGEVVVRPMMYLALSYDHRIVDGREAVQFLRRVKELVEDPERLLLEG